MRCTRYVHDAVPTIPAGPRCVLKVDHPGGDPQWHEVRDELGEQVLWAVFWPEAIVSLDRPCLSLLPTDVANSFYICRLVNGHAGLHSTAAEGDELLEWRDSGLQGTPDGKLFEAVDVDVEAELACDYQRTYRQCPESAVLRFVQSCGHGWSFCAEHGEVMRQEWAEHVTLRCSKDHRAMVLLVRILYL